MARISAVMDRASDKWPFTVEVRSSQPVLACLGAQYAGWNLSSEGYFAMGSGPARALARVEPLLTHSTYRDTASSAVLVLETAKPPPPPVVEKVAKATGLAAEKLTFLYAPTQSLAGTVQIVSRVLEVALHKANDLEISAGKHRRRHGGGADPRAASGFPDRHGPDQRRHHLWRARPAFRKGPAKEARELAEKLPSRASRDYGQPFAEIFKQFKGDFYAIDPLLFSPAEVIVTAIETGDTFRAGGRDLKMLERSLG